MKKANKFLSLVLATTTVAASLSACGSDNTDVDLSVATSAVEDSAAETTATEATAETTEGEDEVLSSEHDEKSTEIYNEVLGDFYEAYETAKDSENVSERYALMAIAEAKLLETGVMIPTTSQGGRYALGRIVPYTAPNVLWGNDWERYHSCLITTEFIKNEDREVMKEEYAKTKGQGTYRDWVISYLEEKGYELKDTYGYPYTSDPTNWDVLATSRAADSEAIINTYDGLMEYDYEGNLSPALAESYEVSDDGLTYTFHLRDDATWVDVQGREYAGVTADDFVAGMQHMLDAQGGLEYLVQGIVKNATEYINGEVTDFSEVGVTAVDDYTLEYTLEAPCSYFVTMLGYGVFAPMNRSYYESQGGKFGFEYDPSAADYNYGRSPETILYCGPYLVTNHTEKSTIVFSANDSYYNKDAVSIKTLTWVYEDGSDVTKLYTDVNNSTIDGCSLVNATVEMAKNDEIFDDYVYVSSTNATSYMAFVNINRAAYANVADPSKVVSAMTDEEKARTDAALLNQNFRLGLAFAFDRSSYNAIKVSDELANKALRNTYTPGTFVELAEDVTVAINGEDQTFPAGTKYGAIIQAQLDADECPIKAFDPTLEGGLGSSDGFDGWYSKENAKTYLAAAVEELAAEGVEISAENPVVIDYPYASSDETYTNVANVFKKAIEDASEGLIQVNLVSCGSYDEWYYAGYYTDYGYEANYSVYDLSGWGPDYGDPATYLDTFLPDYAGYMVKCIGIF